MSAASLIVASAALLFLVGAMHLAFTFFGNKLAPRDAEVAGRLREIPLQISPHTRVWSAWLGFNASHSLGLMLFGIVYGRLALASPNLLFGSAFLCGVGIVFLLSLVVIARRYWFRTPFIAATLALVLYVAGVASANV